MRGVQLQLASSSVAVGCGGRSAENITYFTSASAEESGGGGPVAEACSATICKIDEGICQLRLDFLTFSLTGEARAQSLLETTVWALCRSYDVHGRGRPHRERPAERRAEQRAGDRVRALRAGPLRSAEPGLRPGAGHMRRKFGRSQCDI